MSDTGRIDAEGLKSTVDIVDVVSPRVALKKSGKDYVGICPWHGGDSFNVIPEKQMYHCFGCGRSGDVIGFLMEFENVDFKAATIMLGATPQAPRVNGHITPPLRIVIPPPEGQTPPVHRHDGLWCYTTADGRPWFYIARHNTGEKKENGKPKKYFTPWTWADDGWQKQAIPAPRPLYKLHELAAAPGANVVLVEGEKCADAGAELFPAGRIVTTWPGGAQAVDKADFEPLRGRKVFIWPDPDPAGMACRDALLAKLQGLALEVWVWNVTDCAADFDLAEAVAQGWTYDRIMRVWSRETIQTVTRLARHEYPAVPAPTGIKPAEPVPEALERARDYTKQDLDASARNYTLQAWRNKFVFGGKNGDQVIKCMANCILPFRESAEWDGVLRFDEMRQVIRCVKPTPWGEKPEQWLGSHDVRATEWLDRVGLHYGAAQVGDAILRVAQENGYHPVREYLEQVQWDGTPRIDSWLSDFAGVKDTRFTRFVAAKFLIAAVARARDPGCFVKNVLVLQGPQDAGKSWIPAILGGNWYGEMLSLSEGMKATEQCSKLWIIENSEMAATGRAGDEAVKKFIACRSDTYRPAYAKHVVDMKRCCVFIFTANPAELFTDSTGNVRYWPVTVAKVDTKGLRAVRDQLWAEAAVRHAAGELWWMDDATDRELRGEAQAEQEARMQSDEWINAIRDWLDKPEQRAGDQQYRLVDVMRHALGVEVARQAGAEQKRAGSIMRKLGFVSRNRNNTKVWVRTDLEEMEWVPPSKDLLEE